MTSEEEIQQQFEECGSGEGLNRQQTYFALCMLQHNPTTHEIEEFFNGKEKEDVEACIDLEEFKELVESMGDADEALRSAFKFFDKDESGTIDREELKEVLRINAKVGGMEEEIEEDKVDDILNLVDTNADGKIDIEEMIAAINCHVPVFDV